MEAEISLLAMPMATEITRRKGRRSKGKCFPSCGVKTVILDGGINRRESGGKRWCLSSLTRGFSCELTTTPFENHASGHWAVKGNVGIGVQHHRGAPTHTESQWDFSLWNLALKIRGEERGITWFSHAHETVP